MEPTTSDFRKNSRRALSDSGLQAALAKLATGFPLRRREAVARLPEFDALRDDARRIKDHVLDNLDVYLQRFESNVRRSGGRVHWCRDAGEACRTIVDVCRAAGASTVTKSKTMVGEEIAINEHLEAAGIRPVETDLGEYIIQLRREPPSHIIAPAIHLSKAEVAETFRLSHRDRPPHRVLDEPRALLQEAREELRGPFLSADVGITGANMLIAETGTCVLVTNEGNADLTCTLPRVHIVLASIEKVVPNLEDATTLLRVLARSATGQDMSVYTTFVTGPRRLEDADGPDEFHVVLLDNGRSALLGSEFREILRCIRCGACLNHCPVYGAVGGHAYGWVYSGPIGAVLVPGLIGLHEAGHLPNASTLCGRCESVCPVKIPLPDLLRRWRERQFEQDLTSKKSRILLKIWSFLARNPSLYHAVFSIVFVLLAVAGRRRGGFRRLPFAGGWTGGRDLPAPEGLPFLVQWARVRRKRS